jgi:hypothetical protein
MCPGLPWLTTVGSIVSRVSSPLPGIVTVTEPLPTVSVTSAPVGSVKAVGSCSRRPARATDPHRFIELYVRMGREMYQQRGTADRPGRKWA